MLSSAFRKLYGCDDDDFETAKFFLDGCIFEFEKNLDRNTADLKVQYTLIDRQNEKIIFKKVISSSIPLDGNSPADFASAMSNAVAEQAEKISADIVKSTSKN